MLLIEHCACFVFLFGGLIGLFVHETKGQDEDYIFESEKPKSIDFRCNIRRQTEVFNSIMSNNSVACEMGSIKRQRCIKSIVPDGNCLFRSISYVLYKNEHYHSSVRQNIVNHVVENWEYYSIFIIGSGIYTIDLYSPQIYKRYMGRDRTWGAQVEVVAAAAVYKVCIQVFTDKNHSYKMGEEHSKTVAVYYKGSHYSAVEDVFKSCKPKRNKHTRERNSRLSKMAYKRQVKAARQQRLMAARIADSSQQSSAPLPLKEPEIRNEVNPSSQQPLILVPSKASAASKRPSTLTQLDVWFERPWISQETNRLTEKRRVDVPPQQPVISAEIVAEKPLILASTEQPPILVNRSSYVETPSVETSSALVKESSISTDTSTLADVPLISAEGTSLTRTGFRRTWAQVVAGTNPLPPTSEERNAVSAQSLISSSEINASSLGEMKTLPEIPESEVKTKHQTTIVTEGDTSSQNPEILPETDMYTKMPSIVEEINSPRQPMTLDDTKNTLSSIIPEPESGESSALPEIQSPLIDDEMNAIEADILSQLPVIVNKKDASFEIPSLVAEMKPSQEPLILSEMSTSPEMESSIMNVKSVSPQQSVTPSQADTLDKTPVAAELEPAQQSLTDALPKTQLPLVETETSATPVIGEDILSKEPATLTEKDKLEEKPSLMVEPKSAEPPLIETEAEMKQTVITSEVSATPKQTTLAPEQPQNTTETEKFNEMSSITNETDAQIKTPSSSIKIEENHAKKHPSSAPEMDESSKKSRNSTEGYEVVQYPGSVSDRMNVFSPHPITSEEIEGSTGHPMISPTIMRTSSDQSRYSRQKSSSYLQVLAH